MMRALVFRQPEVQRQQRVQGHTKEANQGEPGQQAL